MNLWDVSVQNTAETWDKQAMSEFASYRATGNGSDRIRWMKQGAAVGAALRFLQVPFLARCKNRLSARGTNVANEPKRKGPAELWETRKLDGTQ